MKYLIIFLLFGLVGCISIQEDFDVECIFLCTTIQGICTTNDNEPIEDLYVEIVYKEGYGLGNRSIRRIKNAVTDENGYYSMEFLLHDDEILGQQGHLQLQAFLSDLNEVNTYLTSDNGNQGQWSKYLEVDTRDTIIDGSFYLPKMAILNINLNNFEPVLSSDYFKVKTEFEDYEFKREAENLTNQIIQIPVAEGETNVLQVSYQKNGVVTNLDPISIFSPENESLELDYTY